MNTLFKRTGGGDFPDKLTCLVTGEPKSGKTSLLGTVPNIVVLDTEPHANNLASIAHLNVPYATIMSSAELEQTKLFLGDASMRQMLAEQLGMDKIEAVAIDTLDSLQAILKRERMKSQKSTQFLRDDWGWLKEEMTAIIESFTALPLHVFFMVHTKTKDLGNAEKGDGRTIVLPGLEGAVAESIAGKVGYSLMAFRRQEVTPEGKPKTSYYLRAEGDETFGFIGNRAAGRLPDIIEPNFATLLAYATAGRKEAEKAQAVEVSMPEVGRSQAPVTNAAATPAVQAPGQNVVQNPDQSAAAAPAAQQPRPADDEPVNAAALSHIKKVYDGIGIAFPEELVKGKTLGEARTVVKMWKAVQEDHAQGKGTAPTPQAEMVDFLSTMGWLPEAGAVAKAQRAAADPKVDGTIEQVKAYVGGDLAKAQEAFDAEYAKEKPRGSLIDWLISQGVTVPTDKGGAPSEPAADPTLAVEPTVQTPVQNEAAGQPVAEVTPAAETADAPPTEEQAIETVKEALGGEVTASEQDKSTCQTCGKPIDDEDIANLSETRFGKRLCVNDYIQATRAS